MKIVHFECGLGNQIACFANYLRVKKNNSDEVYIENLVYSINRNELGFNQWNGFELEDVFGIKFRNITDIVGDKDSLFSYMEREYIKNKGSNNSYSALTALRKCGLDIRLAGVYQQESEMDDFLVKVKNTLRKCVVFKSNNRVSYQIKKLVFMCLKNFRKYDTSIYEKSDEDLFFPLCFDVMKDVKALDSIETELRSALVFPEIKDERNLEVRRRIIESNSVSVHVRRTDFLQYNEDCYRYGYFVRAVNYIKNKVTDPVFFVFSDDSEWCKNNYITLGLTDDDVVFFVDWNTGKDSYRDMQLMSLCKHNIITKSSFGWWASYLNQNPDKIVINQMSEYYSKVYL